MRNSSGADKSLLDLLTIHKKLNSIERAFEATVKA